MCDGDTSRLPEVDVPVSTQEMRNFGTRLGTFLINEAARYEEKDRPSKCHTSVNKLEVFSVCAAVVSKELVSALPSTVNILLKQFGAQHRVAYRKMGDHRIFFGKGKWLSQVMDHLPELVQKHRDSAELNQQSAAKQTVDDKETEVQKKNVDDTVTEQSAPKRRGRPKGKKNVIADTGSADNRRVSRRLSGKPRRSYSALHNKRQPKGHDSDATAQNNTSNVDQTEGQRLTDVEWKVVEVPPDDFTIPSGAVEPSDIPTAGKDLEESSDSINKCELFAPSNRIDGAVDDANEMPRTGYDGSVEDTNETPSAGYDGSVEDANEMPSAGYDGSVEDAKQTNEAESEAVERSSDGNHENEPDMIVEKQLTKKRVHPKKRISSNEKLPQKDIKRRRRCAAREEDECDICFKTFAFATSTQRHRLSHFTAENELSLSSIVIHIQMLSKFQRAETLTGDLLQQVNNYKQKMMADGGDVSQPSEVVVADLAEPSTNKRSSRKRGRKAKLERGMPVVADGKLMAPSGAFIKAEESIDEGSTTMSGFIACDQCCCTLRSAKSLRAHKKNVHETVKKQKKREFTPLHCPHCDFVCDRTQNFTKHLKSHDRADVYTCNLCSYRHIERAEVMRHQRNAHAEKSHECPHCSTKHRNQALLRMHIRRKHEKAFSVICETCGKELYSRAAYNKHMERHADELSSEPNAQIMCNLCARTLKTKSSFQKHLQKFHGNEKESIEMREANEGVNVLANGLFQCRYCATYNNTTAREVRRHIVRRHMKKTHQCDQCKLAFPLDSLLQKHIRVVHYGLEKKKCPKCNKWFRNNAFLTTHVNKVHSELGQEHRCPICNKNFRDEKSMAFHSDIHKPPEERVYRYSCQLCDRKFRCASNYDYHMLTHTGKRDFSCTQCGISFLTKSVLETHMVTHSEDRPFPCTLCDKKFKLKKYLDAHLVIHAGNSFMCSLCHKGFGTSETLDKHICKSMVISQTTLIPDLQISQVDINKLDGSSDQMEAIGQSILVNINDDDKQASEKIYLMCSACKVGFDDVHSAANHLCPVKEEGTEVGGDGQCRDTDDLVVGDVVHDHQNYSLISPQHSAPQLELDIAEDSTISGLQKSQKLVIESLSSETMNLSSIVPEVVDHQTMSAVAKMTVSQRDTDQSPLASSVSEVPEATDTSVIAATPMEMYMCGICNSLFVSQEDVQVHIQLHTQEQSAPAGLNEDEPVTIIDIVEEIDDSDPTQQTQG